MKILLANIPWHRQGYWGVRAGSRWPHIKDSTEGDYMPFPFFLAYATSLLQNYNIDATIIDAIAEELSEDRFLEKISQMDFDLLVAETSTPSIDCDLRILEKISSRGHPVILCGPHAEMYRSEFLDKQPFIKYVLYGEYEFTILELIGKLKENQDLSKIKGLIWRDGDKAIENPMRPAFDINLLPWPHRETLPMEKYCDVGSIPYPSAQMLASRGCPFGCNFCLWPQVLYQSNHYRVRAIDDVINEMEYLIRKRGFKSIYFDDDTFNIGKQRMLKFSQAIKDRGLEKTPWAIMARADLMDEEILTSMRSAGLRAVKYGVESCNQSLIKNCSKRMEIQKVTRMIKMTKELGINVHLTFCFGVPGEKKATIQDSIDYALTLNPDSVQFSLLTPFPGTQIFRELDRQGRILTKDWSKYDGHHHCVFMPDNLTPEELVGLKEKAYQLWMCRPKKIKGIGEDINKFFIYSKREGVKYAVRKTINYFRKKTIGFFANSIYRIRLLRRGIKTVGFPATGKKIKDNYLDIMGVFSSRLAFKGPSFVQIDLTNKCNNNCIACWCNSPLLEEKRNDEQSLAYEKVIELIDILKKMGTREISLSGGGEPFMYPRILEVIRHIKNKGFICHVTTNATLIDERIIRELAKLKVDHLTPSLWAGSTDVYKSTHQNKEEIVLYRIEQMLGLLAKIKEKVPYVCINNVIFNLNFQDIKNMIDFALRVKADAIYFTLADAIPGSTDKLLLSQAQREAALKIIEDVLRSENIIKRINLRRIDEFIKRLSNPFSDNGNYDKGLIDAIPCYAGWTFSRILANGDVNACLKAHRIPVGNIYNENFQSIWNSTQQQLFRAKTGTNNKDDIFFRSIGNDPNITVGCHKGCDNLELNMVMHDRLERLTNFEKKILQGVTNWLEFFNKNNR